MRTRARLFVLLSVAVAAGCARLIGADFDDARLADEGGAPDGASDVAIVDDAATDATPDAGPIDLQGLGDLELWLTADTGVELDDTFDAAGLDAQTLDGASTDAALAQGVAIWRDRSGRAHDGVQLDPVLRPLLVRPTGDAGPSVVRFDRARGACFALTWAAAFAQHGATFFVVSRGDVAPLLDFETDAGRLVFPFTPRGSDDAGPSFVLLAQAGGDRASARVELSPTDVEVTSARVRAGVVGGVETWKNGVAQERSSLLVDAMPPLAALGLGCAPNEGAYANGDLVEVLVYGEALADSPRERIEAFLRTRWGL